MTSVDNFVRKNILTFPTIFPNRTAVLHHALCVIGNGYKWSAKGRIVSDFHRPIPLWDKERELTELEADMDARFKDEDIREFMSAGMRKHIEEQAIVVAEIETRMHERVEIESFYPQSHYALLMNVPANVTKDWEETCAEMKELAEKAGWKF